MRLLTAVELVMLLVTGCPVSQPRRAEEPAFKGMELYSWKPEGMDWHFSLLVGTNREKQMEEIIEPQNAVIGVGELKRRLSGLAKGERVFWRNLAKELVPEAMEKELKAFCEGLQVKLERI